jgi:ABC-type enterochelin transport system substrate-binding protein
MKNTVKLLFVAVVMVAFAACGGAKKEEAPAQDTLKTEVAPAPDTTVNTDSTAK